MTKRKTRSLNIPAKYPDRADRVILGDGCIFSTDCRKTRLNNNILVVGGSGSGKTVSIVEPFLLESFSRSIVCSVTKRGIVNKFIPLLQNRGYKILDLDFVHPSRGNVCFDPLDYINSFADISFLSQSIISGTRRISHNRSGRKVQVSGIKRFAQLRFFQLADFQQSACQNSGLRVQHSAFHYRFDFYP